MSDQEKKNFEFPAGIRPPKAPSRLRKRTLRSVQRALGCKTAEPARDLWTRLWFNHQLRLTWAATVVVLVSGHLLLPLIAAPPESDRSVPVKQGIVVGWDDEIEVLAELPAISFSAEPVQSAMLATRQITAETELDWLD